MHVDRSRACEQGRWDGSRSPAAAEGVDWTTTAIMQDSRHCFFRHALVFLLAFAGDADDEEERAAEDPSRGFMGRFARLVASRKNPHAGELVGVVAGVIVDAGAAREPA